MKTQNGEIWRLWGFLTFRTRWMGLRVGQVLALILCPLLFYWSKTSEWSGVMEFAAQLLGTLAVWILILSFADWVIRAPFQLLRRVWLRLYKPLEVPTVSTGWRTTLLLLASLTLGPTLVWLINERWGLGLGGFSAAILIVFLNIFVQETRGGKWKLNEVAWRFPVRAVSQKGEIVDRHGKRFKMAIVKEGPQVVSRVAIPTDRKEAALLHLLGAVADLGSVIRIIRWEDVPHLNHRKIKSSPGLAQMVKEQTQKARVALTALVYDAEDSEVERRLKKHLDFINQKLWRLNRKEVTAYLRTLTEGGSFLAEIENGLQSLGFHPSMLHFGDTIAMGDGQSYVGIVVALATSPSALQAIEEAAFRFGGRLHLVIQGEPYEKSAYEAEGRLHASHWPGFSTEIQRRRQEQILAALLDEDKPQYLFTALVAVEVGGAREDCERRIQGLSQALSFAGVKHTHLTERALDEGFSTITPTLPTAQSGDVAAALDPLRIANRLFGAPGFIEVQVLSSGLTGYLVLTEGSKLAMVGQRGAQVGVSRGKGQKTPLWLDLLKDIEAFILVLGRTGSGKTTCLGEFILRVGDCQRILISLAFRTKYWRELVTHLGVPYSILTPKRDLQSFRGKTRKALRSGHTVLYEPRLGRLSISDDPCLTAFLEEVRDYMMEARGWIFFAVDELHEIVNPKDVERVGPNLERARKVLDTIIRNARRCRMRITLATHSLEDLKGSLGGLVIQNCPNICFFRGAATGGQLRDILDYTDDVRSEVLALNKPESADGDYVLVLADGRFIPLSLKLSKEELALSRVDAAMQRGKTPEIGE